MLYSISEILTKAGSLPTKKEKIEFLKKHKSSSIKTVLNIMYNPKVKLLLPDTKPPWKKNNQPGMEGILYNEARRLRIFVEGGGYDHLDQTKREMLFISLLEDVDDNDAELLCQVIHKKKIKGLTKKVVHEVYPELELERQDG